MGQAKTKRYDADQITGSFAGILFQGLAEDEFLRIEYNADAFTDVAGVDGEVTRSKTGDRRATVTLILMQTSGTNAQLNAIHRADLNSANGSGVGELIIRDRVGGVLFHASEAWISKAPNASFARAATAREWVFRCSQIDYIEP